jgi:hypothetical protein
VNAASQSTGIHRHVSKGCPTRRWILIRYRLAGGTVLESGFDVSVRLWANLARAFHVGLIANPHHFRGTTFTSAQTERLMPVGVGQSGPAASDFHQALLINGSLLRQSLEP